MLPRELEKRIADIVAVRLLFVILFVELEAMPIAYLSYDMILLPDIVCSFELPLKEIPRLSIAVILLFIIVYFLLDSKRIP